MNNPKMKLSDIIIQQPVDEKNEPISVKTYAAGETLGKPSLILGDWLYIGNRSHALSKETLLSLSITHILNISALIPNAWPNTFQYAQVKVLDESDVRLYDYFEAAASFIDLCNPLNYNCNDSSQKRKILVHCAMGISRSASVTLSYLMGRAFVVNDVDKKVLNDIQNKLELYDKAVEPKMKVKIFEKHKNNKNYSKRKRKQYKYKEYEYINEYKDESDICNGLTLGEAYLFVLERRSCICPNVGFCRQLEEWEKCVWDSNDSTLYQLPFFSPLVDDNEAEKREEIEIVEVKSGCDECCIIL